jgi:hypothetical protein
VAAVEIEARLGDLDEDGRARGVLEQIVSRAAGHHHDVRLRLGFVVERNRILHPDEPPRAEGRALRFRGQGDGGGVRAPLRLGNDELATEQLDGLVLLEEPDRDQLVVLLAGPVTTADNVHNGRRRRAQKFSVCFLIRSYPFRNAIK